MARKIPIMGPGCGNAELEDCPPAFHVEITAEEMQELLLDPEGVSKRLGIDPVIKAVHIVLPKQRVERDRTMYCCKTCLQDSVCCMAWPQ